MAISIYEGGTLVVEASVVNADGTPRDITGTTVEAVAVKKSDVSDVITASVQITNATGGEFSATFDGAGWSPGLWLFQARVTGGGESQIPVEEEIEVKAAYV